MTEAVVPLALLLSDRAWAFGVSGECLMTSDNPAILLRGRPDEDPAMAAGLWDIYLPLDPHRFLFIPGTEHVDRPWLIRKDHRLLLDGGMAQGLNSCVFDQANRHVFWHPDHDPVEQQGMKDYRKMRASWKDGHSDFILVYDALPDRFGVRLKDLTGHMRGPAN
ncbi:MAG: hypothetical protein IT193_12155 [Propionibacteriaceae bacterium]|nr:hypothetical protein [Propionibacteriaceae bacterium]